MKRLLMVFTMALATTLVAQDKAMSVAEARGKIDGIISDPSSMTAVMKQLSASDQTTFLADVNAAIAKMPGSADEKSEKFVAVNEAALKGAQKGNLTALVAEVFATVPPEHLTVINERFASKMFNRAADPSKTYTDDQYKDISLSLLNKVQDRTATTEDAGVRNTFAILMLVRASNGSPEGLQDTLIDSLRDENAKKLAKDDWVGPALSKPADYDPMLGAASFEGRQPEVENVLQLTYTQAGAALMGDLASEFGLNDLSFSLTAVLTPRDADPLGGGGAGALSTLPRTMDPNSPYNPDYKRGQSVVTPVIPTPTPTPEPRPYRGQRL